MKMSEIAIEDKKEFLEKMFNTCKNNNFDYKTLEKVSLINKTDVQTLKKWLKLYIYKYMDASIEEKYRYIKDLSLTFKYKKMDTDSLKLWKNNIEKRNFLYEIYNQYKESDPYELICFLKNKYHLSENETLNILNESIMMYDLFTGKKNKISSNGFYRCFNYYLGTGEEKYIDELLSKYDVNVVIEKLSEFLTYSIEPKNYKSASERILNLINKKNKENRLIKRL